MIIDAHLHLNDKIDDGTINSAVADLVRQLSAANISHAIVLHLETQPWSPEIFSEAISPYPTLHGFINVHPYNNNAAAQLENGIKNLGFIGLKLHPRLQEFDVTDNRTVDLVRYAGRLNIPVLLDAFPDGTHLMQGFSPLKYADLARQCPGTNMIWAHMGGHYAIDFMMLAKRLSNVYMDFSYSLLYYQGSSVPQNMVYCMRSMKFDRIFYGSDYPDRSITDTLKMSMDFFHELGLKERELSKLMGENAQAFFKF